MTKLNDRQQKALLELLWDYMKRDPKHKDRVLTGWGSKTDVGLIASIDAILNEEP